MHKASIITLTFCIATAILAPAYWFIGAFMSWGGPEDDIAILYILFLPIMFHGMMIEKYGFRRTAKSSLVYFSLIAILCVARYIDISGRSGYDQWHANRSLESLAWTLPWFAVGLLASLFSKPIEPLSAEQNRHDPPPTDPNSYFG
jgi:hypothetical protein